MKAVILAGGLGTRLRPLVNDRPKVMALIAGHPFLEYQLAWLRSQGIKELVLCVGYQREQIMAHFGNRTRWGGFLNYSTEEVPLGTAGALRNAQELINQDRFLVLNGDSFLDCDVRAMVAFHDERYALATLALAHVPPSERYGQVKLDPTGRIMAFIEKPADSKHEFRRINGGVYLFGREILKYIPAQTKASLEEDIFPQLIGQPFYGFCSNGYFIDIGVPEDYERAQAELPRRFPLC